MNTSTPIFEIIRIFALSDGVSFDILTYSNYCHVKNVHFCSNLFIQLWALVIMI